MKNLNATSARAAVFFLGVLFALFPAAGHSQHFFSEQYGRRTNVQYDVFHSVMLGHDVDYSIYLPPSYFTQPDRFYPALYYIHGFDLRGKAYLDWVNWRLDTTLDALIKEGAVEEMIVVIPASFITGIVVDWGKPPGRSLPAAVLTFPFRAARGTVRALADFTYFGSYLFVRQWNLKPRNYAEFLTTEFFEHIENCYRVECGRSNRAITGFSTGGYSALSIAFTHPELFDSVSAHSPMLAPASPFSKEADKFFIEYDPQRIELTTHRFVINLLQRIFQNEETWDRHDPLVLACNQPLEGLPVYLDVAETDKRGYDIGASELVRILLERGVPLEFELIRGLPPHSNHTYPGYLNGRVIAAIAQGKTRQEIDAQFRWKGVTPLINPAVQQIEFSLRFHSREFVKR